MNFNVQKKHDIGVKRAEIVLCVKKVIIEDEYIQAVWVSHTIHKISFFFFNPPDLKLTFKVFNKLLYTNNIYKMMQWDRNSIGLVSSLLI